MGHRGIICLDKLLSEGGNIIFAIASGGYLAGIIVAQGRLREAERIYKQSIQLASTHDKYAT